MKKPPLDYMRVNGQSRKTYSTLMRRPKIVYRQPAKTKPLFDGAQDGKFKIILIIMNESSDVAMSG